MPVNTKEIRRRIKSVESTKKITKAMEMVAAAKVRRAQERVLASRPYSDKLRELFGHVTANLPAGEVHHALLDRRTVKKTLLVVVTSDKGLCGGYNANIIRFAVQRIRELKASGGEATLLVIGTKGVNFFKRSNFATSGNIQNLPAIPTFLEAGVLVEEAQKLYEAGAVDAVELLYTKFHSLARYEPFKVALLPAVLPETTEQQRHPQTPYLFEPDAERMMDEIIPAYLKTTVYQALLEAVASELANKMMAMGAASKNAGEMIANLSLIYNKARQAGITQEILEVVGGAEALKG